MKEILYKAKVKNWKELSKEQQWVEGYYAKLGIGENTIHFIIQNMAVPNLFRKEDDNMYFTDIRIDPETVCQYTGHKDNHGVLMWEHDLICCRNNIGEIKFGTYRNAFDSTVCQHVGFFVDWNDDNYLRKDLGYWVNLSETEIIGNTIDNPVDTSRR